MTFDWKILPLPDEPVALRTVARTLLEQAPEVGLPVVLGGAWIADPLWERWGATLGERGMSREAFNDIVAGNGNELRLWVVGERPWQQYASGLAGRLVRRLLPAPAPSTRPRNGQEQAWQAALGRVGLSPGAELSAIISRLGELHLLYDMATPNDALGRSAAFATIWAGARPRDPEVPFGEGLSQSSPAEALAEALGRFLLKDPAYPPRYSY
jgi:hypothetical protein